jgi:membrane protein
MDKQSVMQSSGKQVWRGLISLLQHYRETKLGQAAGSLTFITLMSLVPLLTVMLAIFTAFPAFSSFQVGLEKYFLHSLIPADIASPVLKAVTQFAAKAKGLGLVGLLILLLTALTLLLTTDKTLNAIWGVTKLKPWGQRLMIYAVSLTLGPLMVGMLFSFTSLAITATKGWWGFSLFYQHRSVLFDMLEWGLMAVGFMIFYKVIPNTWVRWRHALVGGVFTALALALIKAGLSFYLKTIPSHSLVYGTFATLPILLLWIYLAWSAVLLGALITAGIPSFLRGQQDVWNLSKKPGWQFALALRCVEQLAQARDTSQPTLNLRELTRQVHANPYQCQAILERLERWGWLVRNPSEKNSGLAWMLLKAPEHLPLSDLMNEFLLSGEQQHGTLISALLHVDIQTVADWIRHTKKLNAGSMV